MTDGRGLVALAERLAAEVTDLEKMQTGEWRATVRLLVDRLGTITIRRVYFQEVTDDAGRRWMVKWPRRHDEQTPHGWSQGWVQTARATGRFADVTLEAFLAALAGIV